MKPNVLLGNYGVNRSICKNAQAAPTSDFIGLPLSMPQIRPAAATLLVADSGYSLVSWTCATNGPGPYYENSRREDAFYIPGLTANMQRTFSARHEEDAIEGRHPGRSVNVGFADGHVNRLKADELLVEEVGDGYRNRSPLWVPR